MGGVNFTIGIPTHNRYDRQFDNSIGMFVSTLPFRVEINDEETISDFHQKIKTDLWQSLKHQKYPYNMLVNELVEIPGFFSDDVEVLRHFAPRHSLSEVSIFINLRDKLKDNIIDISIDYQKDLFTHYDIELIF